MTQTAHAVIIPRAGDLLSTSSFTVPAGQEGSYEIRGGCAANTVCTATVAYRDH
jgi:hypothetical protein